MTDPRLAWLLDQIEADEATAKAASELWPYRLGSDFIYVAGPDPLKHIKTWDPARALATVAALRKILELHSPNDPVAPDCEACADERTWSEHAAWPCPTVKAIAGIFKDRDGYEDLWGDEH